MNFFIFRALGLRFRGEDGGRGFEHPRKSADSGEVECIMC
jgi:hypothetical protein